MPQLLFGPDLWFQWRLIFWNWNQDTVWASLQISPSSHARALQIHIQPHGLITCMSHIQTSIRINGQNFIVRYTHTLNTRMVDSESKPICIAINGSEIIDVEVNGKSPMLLFAWHYYKATPSSLDSLLHL